MHISDKRINLGILLLRAGLGIFYILHGLPKLLGGPELWEEYGQATRYVGITAVPVVFGFLAAMSEFFGGILLILGLYLKPAFVLLIMVMIVATAQAVGQGEPYAVYSHPLKMILVFVFLLVAGTDQYTLDEKMKRRLRR